MKNYIPALSAFTLMMVSCGSPQPAATVADDTIAVQPTVPKDSTAQPSAPAQVKPVRKLRYLYAANGGLIGFFDDGSVSGCPRCDLIKENIATLLTTTPHARYESRKDYLAVNGDRMEFYENGNLKPEWVLFEYRWSTEIDPENEPSNTRKQ